MSQVIPMRSISISSDNFYEDVGNPVIIRYKEKPSKPPNRRIYRFRIRVGCLLMVFLLSIVLAGLIWYFVAKTVQGPEQVIRNGARIIIRNARSMSDLYSGPDRVSNDPLKRNVFTKKFLTSPIIGVWILEDDKKFEGSFRIKSEVTGEYLYAGEDLFKYDTVNRLLFTLKGSNASSVSNRKNFYWQFVLVDKEAGQYNIKNVDYNDWMIETLEDFGISPQGKIVHASQSQFVDDEPRKVVFTKHDLDLEFDGSEANWIIEPAEEAKVDCIKSYSKFDGSKACAFFLSGHLKWSQADEECWTSGAQLPVIKSKSDNDNILSLKPPNKSIWLGIARSKQNRNVFESYNFMLTYTNWASGEPDDRDGSQEDCVSMLRNSGEWDDLPCTRNEVSVLCEKITEPMTRNTQINCEKSYKKSDGSTVCAFFLNGYFEWSQADEECREQGAHLPIIKSESDNAQILSLKTPNKWIWLGISRSKQNRNVFESYNSKLTYTKWASGEPDDRDGSQEDCISMLRDTGEWDDLPCTQRQVSVLCEKITEQPTRNTKTNCENTYKKSDGSTACGFLLSGYFVWSQADKECRDLGAQLPVINSKSDNEQILGLKPQNIWIWLGISRSKQNRNVFESYNSNLTYTNWASGEPDDRGGIHEDCVGMLSDSGEWDDLPCTQRQVSVLCEKITESPTLKTKTNCENSYNKSDGSTACGFFLKGYFEWSQADEECREQGAQLPVINSKSENEQILSLKPPDQWIWLGISRSKQNYNVFESHNSKLNYTNWALGEPDDRGGNNEDCVSMLRNTGEWDDLPCTQSQVLALCERIY